MLQRVKTNRYGYITIESDRCALPQGMTRTPAFFAVLFSLFPLSSWADNYFNPAFLSNDPTAVADLSRFEQNHQAPGSYRVDVYLNDTFLATRNVAFKAQQASSLKNVTHATINEPLLSGNSSQADDNNSLSSTVADRDDDTGLQACLTVKNLEKMGVNIKSFPALVAMVPDACVDLPAAIPQAFTKLDFEKQRLDISIPQAAISNSARGYIPPEEWDQGIPAVLLNYNFTGSNTGTGTITGGDVSSSSNNYFLSLNSGLNIGDWRLRDNSSWNYQNNTKDKSSNWQHVSTYAERTIVPLKAELVSGDSNTPSDVFDSLGFRGVQLASDDNMLPDSLKGFAPTIRGIAKGNAQVTIKQNGYTIYQTYVPPGAFTINDLYATSSSGDLIVSIKESDGSETNYTVPYSAVPVLQRDGRVKYALTAGKYRSGNDDQVDPRFLQGTLAWGLPDGYTAYGGVQYSDNYRAVAMGLGKNMGDFGAISADITQANSTLADGSEHHGQSVRFLYAKSLNSVGTNFELLGYRYSTEGFYTLDETAYKMMSGYSYQDDNGSQVYTPSYNDYYNLYYTKKGKIQINISQQVGDIGSLFITGSQQSYWHTDKTTTLVQTGYNSTFNSISYSLTYNYNKAPGQSDADQILSFNVSVPFIKFLSAGAEQSDSALGKAYATYSNSTDTHGNMTQQAGISGTLLKDNNLNYSVQQGYRNHDQGEASGSASLNYQGTYGNANLGYNYGQNYQQINYGLAGGVVLHRHGLTLSQPLGDTNVLISAPGADGVSVDNAIGVKTDWRGYAVIPYATTYRQNRIALNTTTMNLHTDIDDPVANVVPTQGALVEATFKARVGLRGLITLIHDGRPVPFGATVSTVESENASIVGDDGQVYLSGMPLSGKLKVQWGDKPEQQCMVTYSQPESSLNMAIVRSRENCQ